MEPYTVALTSCGRFDLLERTLGSLLPCLEGPVAKLVVTEDSGDPGVHDVVRRFSGSGLKFEVLVNDPPIGLIRSIDRLYSHVETEWVFHCEDDWEFFSDGFIERSFAVLKESDRHSMAGLRIASEFPPGYMGSQLTTRSGVAYHVTDPAVAGAFAACPSTQACDACGITGSSGPILISGPRPRNSGWRGAIWSSASAFTPS